MSTPGLCKPSAYGAAGGAAVGLVVWALVSFVPAFHTGVPQPVVAVLPFALGWAGHVITAWITPHPPVTPAPAKAAADVNIRTVMTGGAAVSPHTSTSTTTAAGADVTGVTGVPPVSTTGHFS